MKEIPKKALESLPWGYECKWGDGKAPESWKGYIYWHRDWLKWNPCAGFGLMQPKNLFALPVTLEGHELVKVGEIAPAGSLAKFKRSDDSWDKQSDAHAVCDDDAAWYMRPIAAPVAPKAESVACPACGKPLDTISPRYRCVNSACDFCDVLLPPAMWNRLTVALLPLTCPVCGGVDVSTSTNTGVRFRAFCTCGVCGPWKESREIAEAAFRALRYEVKA